MRPYTKLWMGNTNCVGWPEMRLEMRNGMLVMILSERNLRTLLTKLRQGDSACTIVCQGIVAVRAEHDEQHYENRIAPGEMHPTTEQLLDAGSET